MKERPILFSGPMVKAIIEGRKTQTRRIVKPHPPLESDNDASWPDAKAALWRNSKQYARDCCPYGQPGDRLWVRETWADTNGESGPMISYRAGGDRFLVEDSYPVDYSRYPGCQFTMWCGDLRRGEDGHKWRPSIFMPRWASRITLEVTGVRVERLQSMPRQDAIAEGIEPTMCCSGIECGCQGKPVDDPTWAYQDLWDEINGKGSWAANPWVWVLSFRNLDADRARGREA